MQPMARSPTGNSQSSGRRASALNHPVITSPQSQSVTRRSAELTSKATTRLSASRLTTLASSSASGMASS